MSELLRERNEMYRTDQVDVASLLSSVQGTSKLSKLNTFTNSRQS